MENNANGAKPEMVDWYNPSQLLNTAVKTTISTIVGENADPRLVTAAATGGKFFDYSHELLMGENGDFEESKEQRDEIWIDYVSDVGDGWNPTYSVAYSLARQTIDVSDKTLRRGEILIFGGDAVYPTANDEEYGKKFVEPYKMAFNAVRNGNGNKPNNADMKQVPHVFALPGNHDWYDSLVAFQKIFCTRIFNDRIFAGGWQTRQKRSYFALKLPQKWWLLGVDLQLSHNIDVRQLEYFESIIEEMEPDDKVILCVPEPYWVKAIKYQDVTKVFEKKEESIERLEKLIQEKHPQNPVQIKLYLAGDLHHYRRFESEDDDRIQKITAGGGGAFLHPTHDFDFRRNQRRKKNKARNFALKRNYPAAKDSRKMDWKNLYGFIFNSPAFGILTAVLYPLLALLIRGKVIDNDNFSWTDAFKATIDRFIEEPLALIVVLLLLMGLVFFTDSNSMIYRRIAGTIHGLTHLGAIFVLGWLGYRLSFWFGTKYGLVGSTATNLVWFGCILLVCGVGGYIVGSIIMGVYLFVSLHIFGRHDNEAFSALKIEDYKNFVRLHIGRDGKLSIYPLKIEKVGREWIDVKVGDQIISRQPKKEIKPELIEPITPIG